MKAALDDARARPTGRWADRWALAGAVVLLALSAVVAAVLGQAGHPVRAGTAPLFANWLPHVGPGTPAALGLAALVVWRGPALAVTLPWRRLLATAYPVAVAWIFVLALVDGWQRGLAGRLTTRHEYLAEVPGVTDVPAALRGFTGRILDFQPDSWTTHVSGHPPGALLVFVGLDRIGLPGGGWAAVVCVLVAGLVSVAVPVTLRALGDESAARASVPFLVLFPGAVWLGVSADGLFAGVTASGLALLAVGLSRRGVGAAGCRVLAGVLLVSGCYLSYGLVLIAVPALAVVVSVLAAGPNPWTAGLARMTTGLAWAVGGGSVVLVAFTVGGFWWPEGYRLVVERYYQGIASDRPYAYWVWANLAALLVCAGPATAAVLRRATAAAVLRRATAAAVLRRATAAAVRRRAVPPPAVLLTLAAAGAILAADLSGLSKAEVERIWLPFAVWLMAGTALLPAASRRRWLVGQAAVALTVNHLLLTVW